MVSAAEWRLEGGGEGGFKWPHRTADSWAATVGERETGPEHGYWTFKLWHWATTGVRLLTRVLSPVTWSYHMWHLSHGKTLKIRSQNLVYVFTKYSFHKCWWINAHGYLSNCLLMPSDEKCMIFCLLKPLKSLFVYLPPVSCLAPLPIWRRLRESR